MGFPSSHGGEAGQYFGPPIGAERLEIEVPLQPDTGRHQDMVAVKSNHSLTVVALIGVAVLQSEPRP